MNTYRCTYTSVYVTLCILVGVPISFLPPCVFSLSLISRHIPQPKEIQPCMLQLSKKNLPFLFCVCGRGIKWPRRNTKSSSAAAVASLMTQIWIFMSWLRDISFVAIWDSNRIVKHTPFARSPLQIASLNTPIARSRSKAFSFISFLAKVLWNKTFAFYVAEGERYLVERFT